MPDLNKYHVDFSPRSYWDVPEERLARIKGTKRRLIVEQAIRQGRFHEIPRELLCESLSRELSRQIERLDFQNMGGEYLPPLKPREIEIARIVFDSTTSDVVSFRARKSGNRIHYSVIDEYEHQWMKTTPRTSIMPISLRRLILMIDNASYRDEDCESGCCGVFDLVYKQVLEGDIEPDKVIDYCHVSSPFYPEITSWYQEAVAEWVEKWKTKSDEMTQSIES